MSTLVPEKVVAVVAKKEMVIRGAKGNFIKTTGEMPRKNKHAVRPRPPPPET